MSTGRSTKIVSLILLGICGAALITGCIVLIPRTNSNEMKDTPVTPETDSSILSLTVDAVAQHGDPLDCWVILHDKVYNLTGFLPYHPGGVSYISDVCGKNGTKDYDTVHGSRQESLLDSYPPVTRALLGLLVVEEQEGDSSSTNRSLLERNSFFSKYFG